MKLRAKGIWSEQLGGQVSQELAYYGCGLVGGRRFLPQFSGG